jgi:hypothetical protein
MLSPQEVEAHWAYRLTRWLLDHGDELLPLSLVLMGLLFLVCLALVWARAGARWIAVYWIWREFLRGLRARRHPGGAGGYSHEYTTFMASPEWRRQRERVLRRDGHRCQGCGGRRGLEAHHLWYAKPLPDTPDWGITTLCAGCHTATHGRAAASTPRALA